MPRKEKEEKGSPGWITTMSDMNTLLLTFFVMLVGMMTLEVGPKKKNFLELERRDPLYTVYPDAGTAKKDPKVEGGLFPSDHKKAVELDRKLRKILPAVSKVDKGILVTLGAESEEFAEGDWRLTAASKRSLGSLAELLKRHTRRIFIKGYTESSMFDSLLLDGERVRPVTYESMKDWSMRAKVNHWLLAYLRGKEVAQYLIAAGIPADQLTIEPMAYRRPLVGDGGSREAPAGGRRRIVQIIVSQTGF